MAFSLIAHVASQGGANGTTSSGIDTSSANLIIICSTDNNTAGSVSDSKGNTWTSLTAIISGSGTRTRLHYCLNPIVGTGHTFSFSFASSFAAISVSAWSGANTSSVFDVENGANTAGATSLACGSVTPGEDNELLIMGTGDARATTASIDIGTISDQLILIGGTSFATGMAYQVQTTATTRNPTWSWTGSSRNQAVIATFKASANINISIPAGNLVLSESIPNIADTNVIISVPSGNLVFSHSVPDLDSSRSILIPSGNLIFTKSNPNLGINLNRNISVPSRNLVFTKSSPNVNIDPVVIIIGSKDLILTTSKPNRVNRNPSVINIDSTAGASFVFDNFASVTISTNNSNDLIIIAIQTVNLLSNGAAGVNSIKGGGLTFLKRISQLDVFDTKISSAEIWYARAPDVLYSQVFNIFFNQNFDTCAIFAFAADSPDLDSPFSTFSSIPVVNSDTTGSSTTPQINGTVLTPGSNNLILGFRFSISEPSGQTPGSGFSNVGAEDLTGAHIYVESKVVNSEFFPENILEGQSLAYWTFIGDILVGEGSVGFLPDVTSGIEPNQVPEEGLFVAVEVDVYDKLTNGFLTLRLVNRGPFFESSSYVHEYYESLELPVSIGTQISANVYGQTLRGNTAGGDITFLMSGLEAWFNANRFHWVGREFRVYTGFSNLGIRTDLTLINTGTVNEITHDFVKASIKIADKTNLLNKPLLTDVYDNTFPASIIGKVKPKLFGKVHFLEPILEDEVNLIYRITVVPSVGNALDDVTNLWVGGIKWNKVTGTPGTGEWSVDIINGTVELGSVTLGGEVRVDAQVPGWESFYTGDLLRTVIELAGGVVDSDSQRFFLSPNQDDTVGYFTGIDSINVLNLLDEITQRQGGWWTGSEGGKVLYGPLTYPNGPFVSSNQLNLNQIVIQEITQSQTIPAVWRVRTEYNPVWNPGTQFFEGITDEEKASFSLSGTVIPQLDGTFDSSILNLDSAAGDILIKTLYNSFAGGFFTATRLFAAWKVERRLFDVKAFCDPSLVKIYEDINIEFSFLSFSGKTHSAVKVLGGGPNEFQIWG